MFATQRDGSVAATGATGFWLFAFLSFSAFDLILTWLLVGTGTVYEANPVAADILRSYGWFGLAIFKIACLSIVLAVTLGIRCINPMVARRLLRVGCCMTGVVVAYSLMLLAHAQEREEPVVSSAERRIFPPASASTSINQLPSAARPGALLAFKAHLALAMVLREKHGPRCPCPMVSTAFAQSAK